MKKPQASLARAKTRLSRSASANASRKDGFGVGIFLVAGVTLLLVAVFFLQARLGGFGSRRAVLEVQGDEDDDPTGLGSEERGALGDKLKIFAKSENEKGPPDESFLEEANFESSEDEEMEDVATGSSRESEDGSEDDDKELDDEVDTEVENGSIDGFLGEDDADDTTDVKNNTSVKVLERSGQIRSIPRNVPEVEGTKGEQIDERQAWHQPSGASKVPLQNSSFVARKFGMRKGSLTEEPPPVGTESFSSDDELVEGSARKRLSEVVDVEDALQIKRDRPLNTKSSGSSSSWRLPVSRKVFDTEFARKVLKAPVELWNPTGSSLLQDPDSIGPGLLTKNDKIMLKAFRKASEDFSLNVNTGEKRAAPDGDRKVAGSGRKELLSKDTGNAPHKRREHARRDGRKWGAFPGLDSKLSFSEFTEQFFEDETCELNVFMAWNSPPWSYTVRHQRGLESVLHFHPKACVVMLSETMELDFFKKFVNKGYRVAVVRPNLEELLEGTPADVFASIWLTWRKIDLFHIHYSDLLRLAALYKYGGVYLDSDIIILRPLDALHNAIGQETLPSGATRLNGAVMAFEKSSPFMEQCLEEYTATYNDTLAEWNGADLVTRVAAEKTMGKEQLDVLPSSSFFPIPASEITRYMSFHDDALMSEILNKSYALHLWNRATAALVPESASLVGRLLDRHCIWCNDLV